MPDDANDKTSDMEASIRERIAEHESELWLGSRLLAGTIGVFIGERIIFTAIGILLACLFLAGLCG